MIYTVTLNPAIDHVVFLNGMIKTGAVNRAAEESYHPGGKGINVSRILCALGADSVCLGFTAGETGRWLENDLQSMGLKTAFYRVSGGMTRINLKIKGTEETEINGKGPYVREEEFNDFLDTLKGILREGDILALGGSIPAGLTADSYERLAAVAAERKSLTVVDAEKDYLRRALKYHPFLIKPNLSELEVIFDCRLQSEEAIAARARQLRSEGAENVLVSLGGSGAILADAKGHVRKINCPQGKVINSVGAGDSMVAGFLSGWLRTGDYAQALKLGTAAGSATAFSLDLADGKTIERVYDGISDVSIQIID